LKVADEYKRWGRIRKDLLKQKSDVMTEDIRVFKAILFCDEGVIL
jgi:hypothetical protein